MLFFRLTASYNSHCSSGAGLISLLNFESPLYTLLLRLLDPDDALRQPAVRLGHIPGGVPLHQCKTVSIEVHNYGVRSTARWCPHPGLDPLFSRVCAHLSVSQNF